MKKDKCVICNRKEGRSDEFGHRIGYYELSMKIGQRPVDFMICTKCNRCFVKDSTHDSDNFKLPRDGKRTVIIQSRREKGGSDYEEQCGII